MQSSALAVVETVHDERPSAHIEGGANLAFDPKKVRHAAEQRRQAPIIRENRRRKAAAFSSSPTLAERLRADLLGVLRKKPTRRRLAADLAREIGGTPLEAIQAALWAMVLDGSISVERLKWGPMGFFGEPRLASASTAEGGAS